MKLIVLVSALVSSLAMGTFVLVPDTDQGTYAGFKTPTSIDQINGVDSVSQKLCDNPREGQLLDPAKFSVAEVQQNFGGMQVVTLEMKCSNAVMQAQVAVTDAGLRLIKLNPQSLNESAGLAKN